MNPDSYRIVCRDGTSIPLEQVYRENQDYRSTTQQSTKRPAPLSERYADKHSDWHLDLSTEKQKPGK